MSGNDLKPKSDNLRSALRWLSQHGPATKDLVDEAGRRHDLSPLEMEFLLREFSPSPSSETD